MSEFSLDDSRGTGSFPVAVLLTWRWYNEFKVGRKKEAAASSEY